VAPCVRYRSLGIDGASRQTLPDGVRRRVATPGERAWLAGRDPAARWDVALFAMKEAVYKAWSPLTGRWLGFHELELGIDPAAGTFAARLRLDDPPASLATGFEGRFTIGDDAVLAAVALPS
jgi:4'-phosphopantetheinyl transferase EntD